MGRDLTELAPYRTVKVFDGVDWYLIPTIVTALLFLIRERPTYVALQWWTGAVLHAYLLISFVARIIGSRVIVEFHEIQDTGEAKLPGLTRYVTAFGRLLAKSADAFVVHSEYDRPAVVSRYRLTRQVYGVIPLAPFDHYRVTPCDDHDRRRIVAGAAFNVLYFGVIRPFKGVEDLVHAFGLIPKTKIDQFWLTIVGETWEGWTRPAQLIEASKYRHRITFVNRYVHDNELAVFLACADAVALPYHRSSMSGPLHVAMAFGLPLVVTRVGGLPEAVSGYGGAIVTEPRDPAALSAAITRLPTLKGKRFAHPHTWAGTASRYGELFRQISKRAAAQGVPG